MIKHPVYVSMTQMTTQHVQAYYDNDWIIAYYHAQRMHNTHDQLCLRHLPGTGVKLFYDFLSFCLYKFQEPKLIS